MDESQHEQFLREDSSLEEMRMSLEATPAAAWWFLSKVYWMSSTSDCTAYTTLLPDLELTYRYFKPCFCASATPL